MRRVPSCCPAGSPKAGKSTPSSVSLQRRSARPMPARSQAARPPSLALRAVGVGPGDEVVTVSSFVHRHCQCHPYRGPSPLFVDIEPDTFNLDPELLDAAITPRTRAILCVHQIGMPCDLDAIVAIADRHGLPVVEDAACAAGSEFLTTAAGSGSARPHGDIACFSFHPRKLITTGEGGMLTTANPEWDRTVSASWRQHGDGCRGRPFDTGPRPVVFESYPVESAPTTA